MPVLEGIKWLSDFKLHHLTNYQYFRSYCAQGFKMLCTRTLIIIYDAVRPYYIASLEKSWRPIFLEETGLHFSRETEYHMVVLGIE